MPKKKEVNEAIVYLEYDIGLNVPAKIHKEYDISKHVNPQTFIIAMDRNTSPIHMTARLKNLGDVSRWLHQESK